MDNHLCQVRLATKPSGWTCCRKTFRSVVLPLRKKHRREPGETSRFHSVHRLKRNLRLSYIITTLSKIFVTSCVITYARGWVYRTMWLSFVSFVEVNRVHCFSLLFRVSFSTLMYFLNSVLVFVIRRFWEFPRPFWPLTSLLLDGWCIQMPSSTHSSMANCDAQPKFDRLKPEAESIEWCFWRLCIFSEIIMSDKVRYYLQ